MLLWPFNKYPGTDYETFNWEWILHTVKTYTQKVDDFIEYITDTWNDFRDDITDTWNDFRDDITDTWNDFKDWTTGEIDQLHDDFAEYVNVTEDALNTGAIANGAVTRAKIDPDFLEEIDNNWITPELFGAVGDGVTDDTSALEDCIADGRNIILNGVYKITNPITFQVPKTIISMGATIKNAGAGRAVNIYGTGTTIKGVLYVEGDHTHTSEHNHGVAILSAHDINIDTIVSTYNNGDGVYIGQNSDAINISHIAAHYNARNGLSIVSGTNINIDLLNGDHMDYLSPYALMDIEPNEDTDDVSIHIGQIYDANDTKSWISNRHDGVFNVDIDSYYSETTWLNVVSPGSNSVVHIGKAQYMCDAAPDFTAAKELRIDTLIMASTGSGQLLYGTTSNVHIGTLKVISAPNVNGLATNTSTFNITIDSLDTDIDIPARNVNALPLSIMHWKAREKSYDAAITSGVPLNVTKFIAIDNCTEIRLNSITLPDGYHCTFINNTEAACRINLSQSNSLYRPDGTLSDHYDLPAGEAIQMKFNRATGRGSLYH